MAARRCAAAVGRHIREKLYAVAKVVAVSLVGDGLEHLGESVLRMAVPVFEGDAHAASDGVGDLQAR